MKRSYVPTLAGLALTGIFLTSNATADDKLICTDKTTGAMRAAPPACTANENQTVIAELKNTCTLADVGGFNALGQRKRWKLSGIELVNGIFSECTFSVTPTGAVIAATNACRDVYPSTLVKNYDAPVAYNLVAGGTVENKGSCTFEFNLKFQQLPFPPGSATARAHMTTDKLNLNGTFIVETFDGGGPWSASRIQ
jgi:hypothetical protein